jgi:kinesin family protein 1
MVAKASSEGRASPIKTRSISKDCYEPWDMTEREREVTTKCLKLIQGRIPFKVSFIILFLIYLTFLSIK